MSQVVDDAGMGFVRGPTFDRLLLFGAPWLGIVAVLVSIAQPQWFGFVLTLDITLLGYHHLIATFTRTFMDRESLREHGAFALGLFVPVILGVAVLAFAASSLPVEVTDTLGLPRDEGTTSGLWAVNSLYLYWQWWHYTRQAYGVERIYARRAGHDPAADRRATNAMMYLVPAWAFLERIAASAATQSDFFGLPVAWIPVSPWMAHALGIVAAFAVVRWVGERIVAHRAGQTTFAHTAFVVSHVLVFVIGYVVIPSINLGWLVLNIWHNLQYLLIVWLFNANRFKHGVSDEAWVLSWLSQPRNVVIYTLAIFGLSLLVTTAVGFGIGFVSTEPFWLSVVVFQSLNFHHYIVDSRIWKLRKKTVRQHLATVPT